MDCLSDVEHHTSLIRKGLELIILNLLGDTAQAVKLIAMLSNECVPIVGSGVSNCGLRKREINLTLVDMGACLKVAASRFPCERLRIFIPFERDRYPKYPSSESRGKVVEGPAGCLRIACSSLLEFDSLLGLASLLLRFMFPGVWYVERFHIDGNAGSRARKFF